MLYFSVTLSKPKFAKNTLQKHTCSRAAETLGAGEVSNGHIPAQSHLHPQLGWVSQLCSRLVCPNLHPASPPWLRGFGARERGRLVEPELLSLPRVVGMVPAASWLLWEQIVATPRFNGDYFRLCFQWGYFCTCPALLSSLPSLDTTKRQVIKHSKN